MGMKGEMRKKETGKGKKEGRGKHSKKIKLQCGRVEEEGNEKKKQEEKREGEGVRGREKERNEVDMIRKEAGKEK